MTRPPLARAQGISDWTTPSNPRRKKGRKGASVPIGRAKSIAPVGGSNRFGALLGTNGNEGIILSGTGKVTGGSTPPTTDSVCAACICGFLPRSPLTRPVSRPPVQGAVVDVETTTITTLEGSASGRFSWPKLCPSYNLLRLFASLALIRLGAAFAHSSSSVTITLLSPPLRAHDILSHGHNAFTLVSPGGFCEIGGDDTSSFAAITSSATRCVLAHAC